jgi:hypothetical protein
VAPIVPTARRSPRSVVFMPVRTALPALRFNSAAAADPPMIRGQVISNRIDLTEI